MFVVARFGTTTGGAELESLERAGSRKQEREENVGAIEMLRSTNLYMINTQCARSKTKACEKIQNCLEMEVMMLMMQVQDERMSNCGWALTTPKLGGKGGGDGIDKLSVLHGTSNNHSP